MTSNNGMNSKNERHFWPEVIITTGTAHILRADRASTRRMRKMTQDAVSEACDRAREQGARPLTMVDDLSMNAIGSWINRFATCLARSAKHERVSVVGGEMAQMPDTYTKHYVGVWVTVASIKSLVLLTLILLTFAAHSQEISPARHYTVEEIDRMRDEVCWKLRVPGNSYYEADRAKEIEEQLRTYMLAGVSPEDLDHGFVNGPFKSRCHP